MSEPKPFASLGPSLLARKGGARPAMRPQYGSLGNLATNTAHALQPELEDLGWNDMGEDDPAPREAEILPLTPAPANPETEAQARADDADARAELQAAPPPQEQQPAEPEVRRQRRAAARTLEKALANIAPKRSRRSALEQGRRAAFTLRLDAERHLRLRLAATMQNRSAQQLVTEALDVFLADIPELDGLAARVRRD